MTSKHSSLFVPFCYREINCTNPLSFLSSLEFSVYNCLDQHELVFLTDTNPLDTRHLITVITTLVQLYVKLWKRNCRDVLNA
jgi:hypothetical protein